MSALYRWTDRDGDAITIVPARFGETPDALPVLNVRQYTVAQEAGAELPTEPEDVEALVRAIIAVTGCQIRGDVTADGYAMRVVREDGAS